MKQTTDYFSKKDEEEVRLEFRKIAGEDGRIDEEEFLRSDYVLKCPIYKSLTENPLFETAKK